MRHQKRQKKGFNLKYSIFFRDGNHIFFIPVSILAILVLVSWSWIFLKIPQVSNIASSYIAKHYGQGGKPVAVADNDMQGNGSPEDKSAFGAIIADEDIISGLNTDNDEGKNIKSSKYDTHLQDNNSLEFAENNASEPQDQTEPQETTNSDPQIQDVTFSPETVYTQGTYDITVTANDPDSQKLAYKWSASAGSLEGGDTPAVKWKAPQNPGTCDIKVEVTDTLGATDSKTVSVNVLATQQQEADLQESEDTQTAQAETTEPQEKQDDKAQASTAPLRKIVFVSNQTGNKDIFSMNLDGSELTQLTSGGQDDMYPSISPDGKRIVYSSAIGTTWQIFIMNWDGSGKTQITNIPSRCGYPSWSYDAKHIFFEIYEEGSWEIYVMASDGSNIRRLTLKPGIDNWHPSAHPSQNKTLYESGPSGNQEIWQIDIDGGGNTRISKPGRNYRVPKYSPDGQKIAFMGKDGSGKEQIFVMDSNGENIVQLTNTPDQARLPSFSPDGKYIVFNTIGGGGEIFIMNADGSGKKQLTNFPGEDEVAVFMYH